MAPAPPILIYTPGGGVPVGPVSNPPVYSQADVTQLIEGQAYIDVVFGSVQTSEDWVLATCDVENTTDLEPLNIWPGIITERTTAGFRLQLNGMPDSSNYYLHWAVSGVNITPSVASTYLLSNIGVTFTVRLPPSTTVPGAVTITPSDGGAGGSFNVDSVVLTTSDASATFTYTPATYGTVTISTTNSSTLTDPAGIVLTIVAPTYTLTGPSSGVISVASTNFTVTLIGVGAVGAVTITPNDAGVGTAGTFTPSSVNLTTGTPSATFTYTPASYGTKTISTTNSGGLANPAGISYVSTAATYTFSGPSSGYTSVASTNFTVALPVGSAVVGTVTVTPGDSGGGGTFTPTTVALTTAAPSVTFTYTAASNGMKTLAVTNNGGLTNPGNLTYTSSTPPLSDGDPVTSWTDSSGNGHHGTNTGSARPTFKTNIINGKPVVRFTTVNSTGLNLASSIPGGQPWVVFAVMKPVSPAVDAWILGSDTASWPGFVIISDVVYSHDKTNYRAKGGLNTSVAFHVYSASAIAAGAGAIYMDGTDTVATNVADVATGDFDNIGFSSVGPVRYSDCDIAEIILYNTTVSSTDRANIEKYLGTKYAISVAGGSAVQPDTVTGLVGWWKADSLG